MTDPNDKKPNIILPTNVLVDYAFDKMVKNFIKQVRKDGILEEVKRRRYYQKPSEIKRLAQKSKKPKNHL
jgi:ribosomal protein S21